METKVCTNCHENKPYSEYYLRNGKPKMSICKICFKIREYTRRHEGYYYLRKYMKGIET